MEVNLVEIAEHDKGHLEMLLLEYFREIDDSKIVRTIKGEEVNYPYLDSYWTDLNRMAFQIISDREVIGFVLINDWIVCKEFKADKSVAEFYIKKQYRRKGIGRKVAFSLFKKYKGKWEIRQSLKNEQATKFWTKVVGEFTERNFKEVENKDTELIQLFES